MRNLINLSCALALLSTLSCTKEKESRGNFYDKEKFTVLSAEIKTLSNKAEVSDAGIFIWQQEDTIGVYDGNAFLPFTLKEGAGTNSAKFIGEIAEGSSIQKAAVYPYNPITSLSGNNLVFNLPKEYKYKAQNTNAAMVAIIPSSSTESVLMTHLAGVIKFKYTNVPNNAKSFRFVMKDKRITGNFSIDISSPAPKMETPSENALSGSTVTITDIPQNNGELSFYVPVPVGEYVGFFVSLYDEEGAVIPTSAKTAKNTSLNVTASKLILSPGIACGTSAYKTKTYGTKEWLVENCREKGVSGNLGEVQDPVFLITPNVSEYVKARIGAASGRYYTWYEAMTGIPNCTKEECVFVENYSGTDDAGKPFTLDGTEAGEYNIQIRGCCPEGWHIANANDWWDLINAIKTEYNVPDDFVLCGYTFNGGTDGITANQLTKKKFYEEGCTIKNTGNLGAWLRGGNGRLLDGGVWNQKNKKLKDGNNYYDQFTNGAEAVGFGWYPCSRFEPQGVSFNSGGIGKYSFLWTPARQAANPDNARPYIISGTSMNLITAHTNRTEAKKTSRLNVRCVRNY